MQDQDQKISRGMQTETKVFAPEKTGCASNLETPRSLVADLRAKCVGAVLSAMGDQSRCDRAHDSDAVYGQGSLRGLASRPANKYEKVEIEALIFYAVQKTGMALEALRREILDKLSVVAFDGMTLADYQRTRDYLWARLGATS